MFPVSGPFDTISPRYSAATHSPQCLHARSPTAQARAAEAAKVEADRTRDKLGQRLESLSEDIAIVLLTLRAEVPFDEEIAEGLLSNDKPTFSSALQDLKSAIQVTYQTGFCTAKIACSSCFGRLHA